MNARRLQTSTLVVAIALLLQHTAAVNSAFINTCPVTTSAGSGSCATKSVRVPNANHFRFLANAHRQELDDEHFEDSVDSFVGHEYSLASNAGPIADDCGFTEEQIHQLLARRLEYKKSRSFEKSDKILEALNQQGVYVQDKRREWRGDGRNHFGRQIHYIRRGSTYELSKEDLVAVAGMVEDRAHAKRTRTYHRSDELTEKLKKRYKVKVNDKKREWYVVDFNQEEDTNRDINTSAMHYVPSPLAPPDDPTHTMSDESKARIRERLTDRVNARKKKKYKLADEIRDELMEEYSIVIDDRISEWKVVTDVEWDEFAREAQLSQRSAFISKGYENNDVEAINTLLSDNDDEQVRADDTSTLPPPAAAKNEEENQEARDIEELIGCTVVALKEKLREVGLPVSGKKSELIERLMEHASS